TGDVQDDGSVDITANAEVGPSEGIHATGDMQLKVSNSLGLELDHAQISLFELPIKALLIKDASLTYDRTAEGDRWQGAVKLELPKGLPTLDGQVAITDGRLSEFGILASEINRPIGEVVYLQKIGLDVKLIPNIDAIGSLGLSAGPKIPEVDAPAIGLDTSLEANFADPVT